MDKFYEGLKKKKETEEQFLDRKELGKERDATAERREREEEKKRIRKSESIVVYSRVKGIKVISLIFCSKKNSKLK